MIDLYGKFGALKLDRLMKMYPKRVCSKPVFTALPPCIFSGAEFALIPSRDEPFGLVAVEFGRKGGKHLRKINLTLSLESGEQGVLAAPRAELPNIPSFAVVLA